MILCYRFITIFFYPIIICVIYIRKFLNKEDKKRFKEKIFSNYFFPLRRKKRKLIWFHAASIGEVQSILPVILRLNKEKNNLDFLITTVTLSSGNLINKKLVNYKNIYHRYFPVDVFFLVKKFLDIWSPDLVLFVDSEIWPNFILEIRKRKIKSVLINGRLAKKSFNRWMLLPSLAKKIFNSFDLCLASSMESKKYFQKLNVKNLKYYGNLKFSAAVKYKKIINKNQKVLRQKKIWCAASTHKGEEQICLKAHINLKKIYENLITVIIPRHVNRSSEIQNLCNQLKLKSQILNQNSSIKKDKEIVIINYFGSLPKYFHFSKSVFIGKSLISELKQVSGQNPIEAVKMGCKVYHGPFVYNFKEIYNLLKSWGIAKQINNEDDLSKKILLDFKNAKNSKNIVIKKITYLGDGILNNTLKEVQNLII